MTSPSTDGRPNWAIVLFERRSRLLVVVLLLATVAVGSGLLFGSGGGFEVATFDVSSPEHEALEMTSDRFDRDTRPVSQVVIHSESTDTVSKPVLLETLRVQQDLRADPTINATLTENQPTVGLANAVALASDPRIALGGETDIEGKYRTLEGRSDEEIDAALGVALRSDDLSPPDQPPVSALVPREYEAGQQANAQLIIVVHDEEATDAELLEAQEAIESTADERFEQSGVESFVLGEQLVLDRSGSATGESFLVVGPLIVLVVVGLLALSYRDPLDVALAAVGIGLVFVWLVGAMSWVGLSFNQLLIAVPCLLVGLSVDYSLHVVMRYREHRTRQPAWPVATAMAAGVAGVVVAIGATTLTTATGFLAGLASPIGLLREFGVAAAIGIGSAFVVFGLLLPALRIELDGLVDRSDRPGAPSTVGSLDGVRRLLVACGSIGSRRPVLVVALAVLVAAGGAMGATAVETSTDRTDFLPEEQAGWMASLPEPLQPASAGLREQTLFVESTFESPSDRTVEILITGNVTAGSVDRTLNAAHAHAEDRPTTATSAADGPVIESPLTTVEQIAAGNETVATLAAERGVTGTGDDDQDLTALFDAVYAADEAAASGTIHRTAGSDNGGEYDALRLTVVIEETADAEAIYTDARSTAAVIDDDPNLQATATGEPVVEAVEQRAILETVLTTFLLALGVITALLVGVFRLRHRSWSLGLVAMLPVLLAIAWLIGTLWVLSIPFNAETALIVAIAIGLGTDYTVHLTDRFVTERRAGGRRNALRLTLVETGGAVLASGVTTMAGFGLLMLTIIPSLQRFGFVTAVVTGYALMATLVVLPALLVLWDRRLTTLDSEGVT
ncbi:efflux RND transporter permease subunit [Halorubrum vacuolatum]|uniref:Predicted exporter protein, RND superfamily n=1 Tax=Halorubrum vacuolatum TaxID=63740 RepID=A0A238WHX0_HALVU|nr:MMPL family transporter [Halorubrum vacuolatum]SNR45933.1 Predicted exporter protein, RND superfamily [Halorubrum vacuolatum]